MGKEVDRARKAVELAKIANVVMVSGGDTNVYGMAGIVLEVAEHEGLDVDIEILPGVTAILAGASMLGAPVVTDFAVISLSDLLTPWEVIEKRLNLAAEADFVMALYNPKSRKRQVQFFKSNRNYPPVQSRFRACGTCEECSERRRGGQDRDNSW